jgi:nucleotide-binding universal stress UspA family protein
MYDRILVPTDGSDGALAALDEAIDLASAFDATIHSVYVVNASVQPAGVVDGVDVLATLEQAGERATAEVAERVEAAGLDVETAVVRGAVHDCVRTYAIDHDVDLLVMGTHGRTGMERALLGSVTEKVVRTAEQPVLTVRADEE